MFALDIPDEFSCILADWLDLEDVTRLDSAICSSQHREEFLSLLRDKCMFSTIVMHKVTPLNYLMSRQLMSRDVTINIQHLPGVLDRICLWVHSIRDTLHKLTLYSMPASFMLRIIEPAIHIKSFIFVSCELSNDVISLLEQRQVCELTLNYGYLSESRLASELQRLRRICNIHSKHQNSVILHRQFLCLRSLGLNGDRVTDNLLIQFSLHCPNVVHLSVSTDRTTESAMITTMQNFHNLQSLEFAIDSDSTNHLLDVIAERHGHSLCRLSIHIRTENLLFEVHRLLSACLELHTLYLSSPNANFVSDLLSQQHLTLTSLFINSSQPRKTLQAIADRCKHIRVVGLGLWESCDAHNLHAMLSECKQLQKVYMRGYWDGYFLTMMDKLRNSWPKVQFIPGDLPSFDVMAYK